jgi:branched-chain amino acid aminotransferase
MSEIPRRLTTHPKSIPVTKDLKFGQHFTDHWFSAKYVEGRGWTDAKIEPYGKIEMDPAASVLHYGQALFEGMKAFRQADDSIVIFRPDFNFKRMNEGADRLCLACPPRDLFMNGLRELIELESRWVPKEDGCSLYIRPTLIGTEPFLGVRPAREILFYILLSPVGPYYSSGFGPTKIWVEDKAVRAAPGGLGATKAGANYAASLYSGFQAKSKGYDQVLWLDVNHEGIEEVGTMNVFWVLEDEIVTPALNGSILAGGMRDSVLQLLRAEGAKISERRITINEIFENVRAGHLREAFGTGTAAVISPIGELAYKSEKFVINGGEAGPLARRLFDLISDIQRGKSPDRFGWIKPLNQVK